MNNNLKHILSLYIMIVLLLSALLIQNSCNNKEKIKVNVKVPEVVGEFQEVKPTPIKKEYKDTIIYKDKKVVVESPINQKLLEDFLKAKDSLEMFKLYLNAITVREYSEEFNDDFLYLKINATTTGTLDKLKPFYKIKERTVGTEIEVKKPSYKIYAGGELGSSLEFNTFNYKGNLLIQNKKENIWSVSYDRMGYFYIGHNFYLFKL